MIEIPEHLLWDGDITNIKTWEDTARNHFWFSPGRSKEHISWGNFDKYYSILDDGRVVRITHRRFSRNDELMPKDSIYLGTGFSHHVKYK